MILFFANRQLNIIGHASTMLPKGLTVIDDLKTEDIETGVAVFECKIPFDDETRLSVEACTEVGNYILRSHDKENEFYTIIDAEIDTKSREVYVYAEDAGLDLLNEVVGAYAADKAYPLAFYVEKFAYDSGFEIGVNEAADLSRKLSWDGEATAAERIASVATQFDGCEVSYSFDIDGLEVVRKYINIYKQRGKDIGVPLRLNEDIDRIVTKKSIANLATALLCTGGTPEDENTEDDIEPVPITLDGYKYDDGDFYVDGTVLKSRKALARWSRYSWTKEPNKTGAGGHIVKPYSYDTLSQKELCNRALTELKKICQMEVNYEVDIAKLPDNVKIGDRINIVDDAGELYVSARVLQLESSVADQEHTATLGEYLIKGSGIFQKVADLAAQFADQAAANAKARAEAAKKAAQAAAEAEAARKAAEEAAAKAAQAEADLLEAQAKVAEAQAKAAEAQASAQEAQAKADQAAAASNTAAQSASNAQAAADVAQAAVESVERSVESIQNTVDNAQQAAQNAQAAASTAQSNAAEAEAAAAQAKADAAAAAASTELAQSAAENATTKADAAQETAAEAKTNADDAKTTAAAAKLDAQKAKEDVAALGENLETVSQTMTADYARKTELTETEASLQSQISQNAAQISSTVQSLTVIDETANDAKSKAEAAQTAAGNAQSKADEAAAEAAAAQSAADSAAASAASAQSEADKAKAAAATAQSVADKAEAELAKAKDDLETVTGRVGATEEEIAAAQQAVQTAQTAADKAKDDAAAAAKKATDAQTTADTAVSNAATAQQAANDAAAAANLAQQTANEAKGNAATAQAKANEAAAAAATAQSTADTAKTNAANAQAKADQAATAAANAQKAADDADAKAQAAESDLATAKQNLEAVTSRVGATEEEIAAAQTAVATAQAAADKAKQDAAAAQSTADTAKANAATAQTAADNAKTAADNAQAKADEAKKAADDAQADVNALAVRVTKTETDIVQTNEEIKLYAKKTEVAQTLGGYYTKEETNAAISVKANEITSTVERKFAGLQIGGRNLFRNTTTFDGWTKANNITVLDGIITWAAVSTLGWNAITNRDAAVKYSDVRDKEITVSFEVRCDEYEALNSQPSNGLIMNLALFKPGAGSRHAYADANYFRHTLSDKWERIEYTFTASDSFFSLGGGAIDPETDNFVIGLYNYSLYSMQIRNVKLERGNKATDWSPAPEDMASAADLGNYATKSEVTQTAESIKSTVSATYATKTALASTDTKAGNAATAAANAQTAANSAANAAATAQSTANTAKNNAATAQSTADTAKANAATAQTAANNAQSTANTANSEANNVKNNLANNYTPKTLPDTRDDNQPPSWYIQNYPQQIITEFKYAHIIGLTAGENYCALTTTVPWRDKSGGYPKQVAKVAHKEYWRVGISDSEWGAWQDALGKAESAQAAADKAQGDVDAVTQRVTTAETAIEQNAEAINLRATKTEVTAVSTAASNAQKAAEAAQSTANTAKTNAAAAQTAADNAQSTANTAKTNAATAQSTADTAKTNAATAQSTADTAKTNAATAQSTANTAKANAATAQTAANNAQAAADAAQDDVDALAVRVETAETNIEQNAEQIALRATKAEVTQTLGGYYTKSEADAAISVKANEITSTVEEKFQGMRVGGRNLIAGTDDTTVYSGNKGSSSLKDVWTGQTIVPPRETEYIVSFDAKADVAQDIYCHFYSPNTTLTSEASTGYKRENAVDGVCIVAITTEWKRYWVKWTQTPADTVKRVIVGRNQTTNDIHIRAVKLEVGNKATDWSPAPEDMASSADLGNYATKSDVTQTADRITSTVSETYATKTALSATDTKAANAATAAANAQSSANDAAGAASAAQSTANTAKANAATAQSTADTAKANAATAQSTANAAKSAADAAQDDVDALAGRVSAAETNINQNAEQIALRATKTEVTQTLGGYYTKTETDAAISTKANEINLSVNSKVAAVKVGGRNLLRNSANIGFKNAASGITCTQNDDGSIRVVAASGNSNWMQLVAGSEYASVESELSQGEAFVISFTMRSADCATPPKLYIKDGMGYYQLQGQLSSAWSTVYYAGTWKDSGDISLHFGLSGLAGTFDVKNCKIEKGNKPTDWTPAPEDVDADIGHAQQTAENAQGAADDVGGRMTEAEATLQLLVDSISTLVRDKNGASLMTQTADGWSFNIAGLMDSVAANSEGVDALGRDAAEANATLNSLKQAVNDLGIMADYVIITTYNGQPCIELGEGDNKFKLRITNTEIQFADGTIIPAYVSNKKLMIEQAEVKDELQFGPAGGRNLLLNTAGTGDIVLSGSAARVMGCNSYSNANKVLTLNANTSTNEVYYRFMNPATIALYTLEAGETYTISGKVKLTTTSGTLTSLNVRSQANASDSSLSHFWQGGINNPILEADTADWVYFAETFTVEESAIGYYLSFQLYYETSYAGTIQLSELKLEKGNKATVWTAAPEDGDAVKHGTWVWKRRATGNFGLRWKGANE